MKKTKKLFIIGSLLLLPLSWTSAHTGTGGIEVLHINRSSFEPAELTITPGTTLTFENVDTADHWPASNLHPTHEVYPEFDPQKPIPPADSWSFTFNKPGEWLFHDHLFPDMGGKVRVEGEEEDTSQASNNILTNINQAILRAPQRLSQAFKTIRTRLKGLYIYSNQETVSTFSKPAEYDLEKLFLEKSNLCLPEDSSCNSNLLQEATTEYGPQASIDLLRLLQERGRISKSLEDHDLAHKIGRTTAEKFGVNIDSFQLCPMSAYNGGCQHGFFESALGKSDSVKETIEKICGSVEENASYSQKFKFYCYHGVGHGVLMAAAYNLSQGIATCEELSTSTARGGCLQGVFMENVNAGMRGEARQGVFSDTDPLAPCNQLDEKYGNECFINHSGWIMAFYKNNFQKASAACLYAPPQFINMCVHSFGLMVTNPTWQKTILGQMLPSESVEEIGIKICEQVPALHTQQCLLGGLDNLLNFYELDVKKAQSFCSLVGIKYITKCYERAGYSLRDQSVAIKQAAEKCQELPSDAALACIFGAEGKVVWTE